MKFASGLVIALAMVSWGVSGSAQAKSKGDAISENVSTNSNVRFATVNPEKVMGLTSNI
jgi:hypothetical protein